MADYDRRFARSSSTQESSARPTQHRAATQRGGVTSPSATSSSSDDNGKLLQPSVSSTYFIILASVPVTWYFSLFCLSFVFPTFVRRVTFDYHPVEYSPRLEYDPFQETLSRVS
jgi:hypothetical protein